MKTFLILFGIFVSVVNSSSQQSLINLTNRNGGFETGVNFPWLGSISTTQNSSFAYEGSWFGIAQQVASGSYVRTLTYQNFSGISPSNGSLFSLSFYSKSSGLSFENVSATVEAASSNYVSVPVQKNIISQPGLSSSVWQLYEYQFQLSNVWDGGGGVQVSIGFERSNPLSGGTYKGYLDNIVFQQIPEPTTLTLLGLSAGLVVLAHKKRRAVQR